MVVQQVRFHRDPRPRPGLTVSGCCGMLITKMRDGSRGNRSPVGLSASQPAHPGLSNRRRNVCWHQALIQRIRGRGDPGLSGGHRRQNIWTIDATYLDQLPLQCKVPGGWDSVFAMAPLGLSHRYRIADRAVGYALVWIADRWRIFLERLPFARTISYSSRRYR